MILPGHVHRRIRDLQREADAAAAHLRRSADRLREGDEVQSFAERKLAQDLLRPLLPSPPVHSVPVVRVVGAVGVGRWARSLEALRVLADYLKILVPLAVVLGLLIHSVLSGWSGDMTRGYHEMSPKDAARSTAYPKP